MMTASKETKNINWKKIVIYANRNSITFRLSALNVPQKLGWKKTTPRL